MINKQNLWFLTLFSLILVLSVYYVTMPNELLLKDEVTSDEYDDTEKVSVELEESEILVALRVDLEEERMTQKKDLEYILTSYENKKKEKNAAYDKLKYLNSVLGKEEKLESKIKENFNIECFIEIDNNEINVIAISSIHDTKLANNIMRSIQEEFEEKVYVTVNFK